VARSVIFSPQAERDVEDIAVFIAKDSPPSADRFVRAVMETAGDLVDMPEIGRRFESQRASRLYLRRLRVKGFARHSIFYRYHADRELIEVIRIVHGARDLDSLFDNDAISEGDPHSNDSSDT